MENKRADALQEACQRLLDQDAGLVRSFGPLLEPPAPDLAYLACLAETLRQRELELHSLLALAQLISSPPAFLTGSLQKLLDNTEALQRFALCGRAQILAEGKKAEQALRQLHFMLEGYSAEEAGPAPSKRLIDRLL